MYNNYNRGDYYYDPVDRYYTYDPNNLCGEGMSNGTSDYYEYEPKKKKSVTFTRSKLVIFSLVMILVAAMAGFAGASFSDGFSPSSSSSSSASGTGFKLEKATGSQMTVQEISEKVADSIVEIKTESVSQDAWIQNYVTEGAGSGIIVKSDGYIMTNNHVIEGASSISVTVDSDHTYEAEVVGTNESVDIAILKIDADGLSAVTMGDSDDLSVGDMAVVVGNPLGELGDSVSAGIISSTERQIDMENQTMTLIQTDASVNPGNSGGGLFNGEGQLVGVIVAKSSGTDVEGLGFAIPMNTAAEAASDIMEGKSDSGIGF